MSDKLREYQRKRDFGRTAEPAGGTEAASGEHLYVMHMHAASHDHFDLRLEQDGVLRSWALPKGPSLTPGEKRLAVEVEDHPLEYGRFEGVIPKQAYGGGTTLIWDRGSWRTTGRGSDDKLEIELHGKKLRGLWTLVRMRSKKSADRKGRQWLLIKRSDDEPELAPDDRSVVSGRTLEEVAAQEGAAPQERPEPGPAAENGTSQGAPDSPRKRPPCPDPATLPGARAARLPDTPAPQLAILVETAPEGDQWLHEIKFDGYRLLARLEKGRARLITRNGKDWTPRFPALARTLAALPVANALLDGELVALDAHGASSFRRLQETLADPAPGATAKLVYQVFDLLFLQGYDLSRTPLEKRKATLAPLLETLAENDTREAPPVRYTDHHRGRGGDFFVHVCELGLEGMISKQADSPYRPGRQRGWLKTKCTRQDEFVVGGYTLPAGSRSGFGSLLLGAFRDGELVYAGRVGSGFSQTQLKRIKQRLQALETDRCPFAGTVPDSSGVRWVAPRLVADVAFTEHTRSGALRHPVFRGLREDKSPREVTMATHAKTARQAPAGNRSEDSAPGKDTVAGVHLSHPDRVLFPEQGVTKRELAEYYAAVQDWILPHLVDRPLSLLRCPEGRNGDCFFQKHPGASFAKGMPRIAIEEKQGGHADFVYVTSVQDLIRLVQFNVLEIHPWGSRIQALETPDTLIFDLDPGPEVSWSLIAQTARDLRERLQALGLTPFLQATGGAGLHLVVPIKPSLDWDEAKAFAQAVSQAHARASPDTLTTHMAKNKRRGRIFIDYLRNGRGNTSIARYSVRARENAPVATPLRWDELTNRVRANRYTLANIRRRLSALKADPWEGFEEARAAVTAGMRRELGLSTQRS